MEPEIDYAEPGPLTGLEGLGPDVLGARACPVCPILSAWAAARCSQDLQAIGPAR